MTVGCGGGGKKQPAVEQPVVKAEKPAPRRETEEDREAKRQQAATAMIPEDSTCLPLELKEADAPRLELAAIGPDAVICAIDTDDSRLLGAIGCWKVDLASGELAYHKREPLPGRGVTVKLDDGCARGFCVPKAKEADVAQLTTSPDGSMTAVLVGDTVHVFSADKEHASEFSIRGDQGVTGKPHRLYWVGGSILVEGEGESGTNVWVFKAADGNAVGAIEGMGKDARPLATDTGSFSVLDKTRVAIAEQGFSTVTTYEVDTGKRAKLVRKLAKSPCKPAEADAFWKGAEGAGAKCKDHMAKNFGHLRGADAVSGSKNLLVLLRGRRLGELAVLDAKSLAEKKSIRLPWCEVGGAADDADGAADDAPVEKKSSKARKATPADDGGE
ncbi:MAG: hypothetical protein M3680_34495 [Myxococcota bacterium]|nr:hypothetical protein [Myxococcota bacterium]